MRSLPALSPEAGGLCLSWSALWPADIIVSTTAALVSTAIRDGTGSPVSHAMLYAGGGSVIEAVGDDGVRKVPLSVALGHATLGVAYRNTKLDPAKAAEVVSYAARNLGKKYDFAGAAGAGLRRNPLGCLLILGPATCLAATAATTALQSPDRFFCSELVLDAFRKAGAPLIDRAPGNSVPQDLVVAYDRGAVGYVGHVAT